MLTCIRNKAIIYFLDEEIHCTDETQKVETVALYAVVLLPIVRSISDKVPNAHD